MKVLIFGAGLLGKEIEEVFRRNEVETLLISHDDCDIRNLSEVKDAIDAHHPMWVFNAAAYTSADAAELNARAAFDVNAVGADNIARAVADTRSSSEQLYLFGRTRLFHISSNAVFDKRNGVFDECDTPSAESVYGFTKLVGEHLVRQSEPYAWIVRTSFLYGRHGKNFGSTLLDRLRAGETVTADPIRRVTPTRALSVANCLYSMLANRVPPGTYHAVSAPAITWFDFAEAAKNMIGSGATEQKVLERRDGLAPRPNDSVMVSRKLEMCGIRMPSWLDDLRDAVREGL